MTRFRPGYFGRRRDEKIAHLNEKYGVGGWNLQWMIYDDNPSGWDFLGACKYFYEESYYQHLKDRPDLLSWLSTFSECYDNAETNIKSGCDYTKQEAFSTHIQDIAVRNAMRRLNVEFDPRSGQLLQIRSKDSQGWKIGPGNVPFFKPELITQPSLCPSWANKGSVEDFWQSNKWVVVKSAPIPIDFIVTNP